MEDFKQPTPELDPVELDGITITMKRRDPYGHIYLLLNGNELKDLGMFTTIDAARSSAEIYIQDMKQMIAKMEELSKQSETIKSEIKVKKAKKVA